jgi:hypothetical protein
MSSREIKYFDLYLYFLLLSEIILILGIWDWFNVFRGIILGTYILWAFITTSKPFKNVAVILIISLAIYTFVLVFLSNSLGKSFYHYIQLVISLLVFPIMINILNFQNFNILLKVLGNVLIFYAAYMLLAVIFDIQSTEKSYADDEFTRGGVNTITLTFVTIISPCIFLLKLFSRRKRLLIVIAFLICSLFILMTMKRTTILILIISLPIYLIKVGWERKLQYLFLVILSAIILWGTFSIWGQQFLNRYELRGERMQLDSNIIGQEQRTKEFKAVVVEILLFDDPLFSFFGRNIFSTAGDYGRNVGYYFNPKRPIHNDFALLLHSTGLIGFTVYVLFLYLIMKRSFKFMLYSRFFKHGSIYSSLFFVVFIGSLILMYNGSLFAISYRTIILMIFGLIFAQPPLKTDYRSVL